MYRLRRFYIVAILLFFTACNQEEQIFHGYVEGEFLRISPTTSGLLAFNLQY